MVSLAEGNTIDENFASEAKDAFISRSRDPGVIQAGWLDFEKGKIGPYALLELLSTCGPPDVQDYYPETRLASNGHAYTLNQFQSYYAQWSSHSIGDGTK